MAKKDRADYSFSDRKRRLSGTHIAVIATAIIVLITLLTVGIIFLVDAIKKDKWFNYTKANLNKYVVLSENDYKNYELELSIAKPHEIDIDVAILNLISAERFRTLQGDGGAYTNIPVTAGDKLVIRYRGYTLDEKGNEVVISTAMSNITYAEGTELQIGESNSSLPVGFELGLIGKNPEDFAKFEKITSGKIKDLQNGKDLVIYVSGERVPKASVGTDKEKSDTLKLQYKRIDLSDKDEVDKYFGTGFVDAVMTYDIGTAYTTTFNINNKEYNYKDLTINFATSCEKESTSQSGKAPLTVEGYFAYDFGIEGTATASLRNKTVYYDVWIEEIIPYDTPIESPDKLTDKFILDLVNEEDSDLTEAELRAYEGDTIVAKYRNYVKKYLDDAYEEALNIMIENAMWERYLKLAVVNKYPKEKVDEIHKEYVDDVYYQYDYNGGSLQDSQGNFQSYDTVDKFAIAYLGLSEGDDWSATLYTMSENLVKERLILFYIMKAEDILPTDDELAEKVDEIKKEYLDEYLKQYIAYKEENDSAFDKSTLTGEAYDKFVEERRKELFDYYDEDYFEETAYYEIGLKVFLTYPTVYTLDNPKPAVEK